jgi:hypothetical protein
LSSGEVFFAFIMIAVTILNWIFLKNGNKDIFYLKKNIENTYSQNFLSCCIELKRSDLSVELSSYKFSFCHQKSFYSNILVCTPTDDNSVFIKVKSKKYYLAQTKTKAECEWLIQEIKDWLS